MTGKEKCKLLKEIRKSIAVANDIEFMQEECHFEGECAGTCPKCEQEARYLDKRIDRIIQSGRKVNMPNTYFNLIDKETVPEYGIRSSRGEQGNKKGVVILGMDGFMAEPDFVPEEEPVIDYSIPGSIVPADLSEEDWDDEGGWE